MKFIKIAAVAVLGIAASVTVAIAHSGTHPGAQTGTQAGQAALGCQADMARFCAGKNNQNGELRSCLEANKDKVSAACKTMMETNSPNMHQGMGLGQGMGMGQGMHKMN
jgi:hypothetical protein